MGKVDDVMALCCKIAEIRQIKATLLNSSKGAAAAGGFAFLGGLLGGPLGILVGSAFGGVLGWWMTRGEFQPLHQIIREMPPQQKRELYSEVKAVLGNLYWVDKAELIALVMANAPQQMRVLTVLIDFAIKQLGAKIHYA